MKVLILYDVIPEENYRAVVEMSDAEYAYFSKAHGYIINAADFDAELTEITTVVGNAFSTCPDYRQYCETDKDREYFGKWVNDTENVDLVGVEKLIHCGFYL